MPGTDGATFPFWSPDSRHVGFFADRRLKRIDVANALTQTICDVRLRPGRHVGHSRRHRVRR